MKEGRKASLAECTEIIRTSVAWSYHEEFGNDRLFYITKADQYTLLVRNVVPDILNATHAELVAFITEFLMDITERREDKMERWISCRNIRTGKPASALQLSEADILKAHEILDMPVKAGDYLLKYEDNSFRIFKENMFYYTYYR